jgi:hypothetical protein
MGKAFEDSGSASPDGQLYRAVLELQYAQPKPPVPTDPLPWSPELAIVVICIAFLVACASAVRAPRRPADAPDRTDVF